MVILSEDELAKSNEEEGEEADDVNEDEDEDEDEAIILFKLGAEAWLDEVGSE